VDEDDEAEEVETGDVDVDEGETAISSVSLPDATSLLVEELSAHPLISMVNTNATARIER